VNRFPTPRQKPRGVRHTLDLQTSPNTPESRSTEPHNSWQMRMFGQRYLTSMTAQTRIVMQDLSTSVMPPVRW
jgi:hypothetical protein